MWLTLVTRILRLYITTTPHQLKLSLIVWYSWLGHYISMWFFIRRHSDCSHGVKMHRVQLLTILPKSLQELIRPVAQRSAYWCHPEAVLLANQEPQVRAPITLVIRSNPI